MFLPLLRETFPGAHVHGVDIVEANVTAAAERGYDDVSRFDISTVGQHLDPGSFDLVMCVEAVQYLSPADRVRLATGVARVLRPDGLFVLVYPNPGSWLRQLRPLGPDHDPFPYDTRKLLVIAERADFRVQRFFGAGLVTAVGMQGNGLDPRLSALAFRLGVVLQRGRRRPMEGSR